MADVYEMIDELARDPSPASQIVVGIWRDVMDRRGWRQAHDGFDDDIRVEIVETWLEIARRHLPASPSKGGDAPYER